MRTRSVLVLMVALLMVVVTATAEAQRRGGQGGQGGQGGRGQGGRGGQQGGRPGGMFGRGFGGGFGGGLLRLASNEAVQKEVEMIDDQIDAVGKLNEEMRQQRQQGPQINFQGLRDMSQVEREKQMAEFRKRSEEQAKISDGKLAEILLPHQIDRLKEIDIQQQGVRAVLSEQVVAKLKITEEQREKIQASLEASGTSMREQMQALFQGGGGDRDQMREKMTAMRKEMDDKALASLTADQRKGFEEMKGKPFEMPRPDFGGRGRGGPGGQGGQRGGNRPQRPDA